MQIYIACAILDAVLDLYQQTELKRYLDFAEYIIQAGGCDHGNLINLAEKIG